MEITPSLPGGWMRTIAFAILPPLVGSLYLVLWIIAEAGRFELGPKIVMFALFAIAIGISARQPYAALAMVLLIPIAQVIGVVHPPTSTAWPTYLAVYIVGFFVGVRADRTKLWVAAVGGGFAVVFSATLMMLPSSEGGWTSWVGMGGLSAAGLRASLVQFAILTVMGVAFYLACWGAGIAVHFSGIGRLLTGMVDRLKQTDLALRMEQDRARISRELHDAIAHSLAVVVSQAEGALAQSDPENTERSLRNIAAVGRESLTDMRGLIERIQTDEVLEARPKTSDLPALVDRMREIGMDATLETYGAPDELTVAQHTATYRIVQESLTNALKHGGADASVTVTLDWRGPGLVLLVASTGMDPLVSRDPQNPDAGGVGIAGMRERARLAGGWLTAEPSEDGIFLVTAFIPTPAEQRSDVVELEAAR